MEAKKVIIQINGTTLTGELNGRTAKDLLNELGEALGIPSAGVVPVINRQPATMETEIKDGDHVSFRTQSSTKNS